MDSPLDSTLTMPQPFLFPTPAHSSVWGDSCYGHLPAMPEDTLHLPNKESFSCTKVSFPSLSEKADSRPKLQVLGDPRSSQLRAGGDQGSLHIFPQPAPPRAGLAFLGDQSVEIPHRVPLGICQGPPKEGSYRTGTGQPGVLFSPLYGPQEGRVVTPCYQPKTVEQVHFSTKVSDGLGLHRGLNDT